MSKELNTIRSNVSTNLWKWRKYNKYTQEEMGEKIGVTRATYASYEEERALPKADKLITISKLLQTDLETLLKTRLDG